MLEHVDLTIRRGEVVAVVGASGCGKSVFMHILIGLMDVDAGRIEIANHALEETPLQDIGDLDDHSMDQIRRHWAVVFQRNALVSGTVADNLSLWLREVDGIPEPEIEARTIAALRAVGLDPDEVMHRDRDKLSGGMAKRVAVARAIARQPALFFYDEPTTGLDPEHARQIHGLIRTTHEDDQVPVARTTLIIKHDKDLLYRLRPRIAMLHEGRIFFDGSYEAFSESDSPVIRPYFDLMPVLHQRSIPVFDDQSDSDS
ncbi:MAG: ATP-binding cassette domain-containing protein [Planctomycetota bacterium]